MSKGRSGTVIVTIFAWILMNFICCGETMQKGEFLRLNNLLFDQKVSLYLKIMRENRHAESLEIKIKTDVAEEIESMAKWLTIDFSPSANLDTTSKKFKENELKGRINGLIQEMRSAKEGFHKDLPNNSSLIERLEVIRGQIKALDQLLLAWPK